MHFWICLIPDIFAGTSSLIVLILGNYLRERYESDIL